jgi:hypothetical protein
MQNLSGNFNKNFLFSRIGLNGFDNPMRDQKTEDYKRNIGQVRFPHIYHP